MPCVVAALALVLVASASAEVVSPVQKVIELLDENKAKIGADLAAEEKEMAEYSEFCDDETTEKAYAIKTATSTIGELQAEITDAEAQIASMSDEVTKIGVTVADKEKELDEAEAVRATEKAAFEGNEKELVGSIDSMERAIAAVKQDSFIQTGVGAKKGMHVGKVGTKAAITALSSIIDASWVNTERRRALKVMLQSESSASDDLSLHNRAEPDATAGFMTTLEDMKEKAETALSDARTAEMKSKHGFEMMAQSLTDAIKVSKERLAQVKSAAEEEKEAMGKAKNELAETTKTKKSDEAYVATLSRECSEATTAWAQRQEDAKEEIAVIEKAKGILADRVKASAAFVQTAKGGMAAAKADASGDRDNAKRQMVVDKLQSLSRSFKSYALLAMVSAAAADPFEKIRGLIEEMISKLVQEANEEATQKAFCDEELSKSKAVKEDKTMKLDKLQSRLDKAKTTKAELEQAVKELEAEIADLDKADAEATKIRGEEHATYLKSSKDFKDAAEAVSEAITVLKEYYEGALVQTSATAAQPKFGGNKGDSAHVILGILEVSAEDFEKLYMEAEQEETEGVAGYTKLIQENKVARAAKIAEVKGSESEIKSLDVAIGSGEGDIDLTSQELDSVMTYMDKLKPQCETKVMSYAEKKSRREAEIEGLKEALSILEGTALVQTQRRLRH